MNTISDFDLINNSSICKWEFEIVFLQIPPNLPLSREENPPLDKEGAGGDLYTKPGRIPTLYTNPLAYGHPLYQGGKYLICQN